jgi:DNA gyrase subunit A
VADNEHDILVVSEGGYGKRSKVDDYRMQSRGGTGVITLKVTEKTGPLMSLKSVQDNDELMLITHNGVVIRQRVNAIRETGRVAQGVRLIKMAEGDQVAAVAKILQEEESDVDGIVESETAEVDEE